jgi:hypothetical protein
MPPCGDMEPLCGPNAMILVYSMPITAVRLCKWSIAPFCHLSVTLGGESKREARRCCLAHRRVTNFRVLKSGNPSSLGFEGWGHAQAKEAQSRRGPP